MAGKKYKISVKHKFSVGSTSAATSLKSQIRKKVPKIRFSKAVKSGRKYNFTGTITYIRTFDAPFTDVRNAVKAVVKKSAPKAIVTVQSVSR